MNTGRLFEKSSGKELPAPHLGKIVKATLLASATALMAFLNPINHSCLQASGVLFSISDRETQYLGINTHSGSSRSQSVGLMVPARVP